MQFIDPELRGNGFRGFAFIAGEHDGLGDAALLQLANGLGGVFLHGVGDDDMTGICSVNRGVDDRPLDLAFVDVGNVVFVHQARVAGENLFPINDGADAAAGELFHLFNAAVVKLFAVRVLDRHRDRMRRVGFRISGVFQQLSLTDMIRMHCGHGEGAFGQRAGFIEDDRLDLSQRFKVVGALDQDAFAGGRADAAEEAQRDGDHERARAGDHQEDQRAVDPFAPALFEEQRRNDSEQHSGDNDRRGVDLREAGDEILGAGLVVGGVLHQFKNAGHGRLTVRLRHADLQHAVQVHGTAVDIVTDFHALRHGFTGQRGGIQAGFAFLNHAVQRNPFARLDEDQVIDRDLFGVDFLNLIAVDAVRVLRAEVHHRGNGFTGASHGVILEELADLIEEHNGDSLREIAQGQRAEGGDGHQEILIEDLSVKDVRERLAQHFPADGQVRSHVDRGLNPKSSRLRQEIRPGDELRDEE